MYPPPQQPPQFDPQQQVYRPQPGAEAVPTVNVLDSFKFAFGLARSDSSVVLMSFVFSLIPILGPISLGGWHGDMIQRMHRRTPPNVKLTFNDLMPYFNRGLNTFLVRMIFGMVTGVLVSIPLTLLVFMNAANGPEEGVPTVLFLMPVIWVVAWLVGMFTHGLTMRAEISEQLNEGLKLRVGIDYLKRMFVTELVSGLVFGMIAFGLALVGMLFCFVGLYAMIPIIQLAATHHRWQLYERYIALGGDRVTPAAGSASAPMVPAAPGAPQAW